MGNVADEKKLEAYDKLFNILKLKQIWYEGN